MKFEAEHPQKEVLTIRKDSNGDLIVTIRINKEAIGYLIDQQLNDNQLANSTKR